MHLVRTDQRSLDETAQAVDLEQSPADIVACPSPTATCRCSPKPMMARGIRSLRLAALGQLKHPLFGRSPYRKSMRARALRAGAAARRPRLLALWRRGTGRRRAQTWLCNSPSFPAISMEDERLDRASTLPVADLRQIWAYFRESGPENIAACLDFIAIKNCRRRRRAAATARARLRPVQPSLPACRRRARRRPSSCSIAAPFLPATVRRSRLWRRRLARGKFSRAQLLCLQPEGRRRLRAAGGTDRGGKAGRDPQRHRFFSAARRRRRRAGRAPTRPCCR